MILNRPWLLLFAAGLFFEGAAGAQDNAGGGAAPAAGGAGAPADATPATPATPGGASSSFAQPASPATPNAPATGAGLAPPGSPSFRTGAASTLPPGSTTEQSANGDQVNGAGGSASSFGNGDTPGGAQLRQAPATFSVPGFYGRGPQQFTVGVGRLARPRFRFSGNISMGYDDNVFQTPTHPQSVPDQKVQVLVAPATPAGTQMVVVPSGDPSIPDSIQAAPVPATPAKFKTVDVPGVPAPQRIASFVTRTDAKWDVQMASRRQLFTFDLGAGVDYYWDRPGKKEDYTGNVSLVYLRKLTGQAQFTLSLDSSYQSQPDFSQPNLPTSNNVGSYLSTNVKADLSYRLTPRFSTTTSVSYSAVTYEQTTQSGSNYGTTTFGTELRYLFSPRMTLLGELRYSSDMHANDSTQDTTTYYALIGGELTLSSRFNASLRIGEAVQSFNQGGGKQSAPYVEATANYRLGQTTTLGWNGRYGYEEAGAANTRNLTARSGLQLTQIFSPRFQGTLAANLVRTSSKSDIFPTNTPATTTGSTSTGSTGTSGTTGTTGTSGTTAASSTSSNLSSESVQDTIDATLGFYYTLDRHWSFNLTYTYTMVIGPVTTSDYYHQRVFLGASYQF